jgi:hypothetical protein
LEIYRNGHVHPPNHSVRLFVRSGVGEWYAQPKPLVKRDRWRCTCYFGREDTKPVKNLN